MSDQSLWSRYARRRRRSGSALRSTFSTHSGQNTGSRLDQPGAVAALSLIDWSRIRRRSGWRCGKRRGGAEGRRQPRPRRRADQPLIEEAVGGEIGQPVLAEVERRRA